MTPRETSKAIMDDITPYQARLYNAVLFGHRRARAKSLTAVHTLWQSRRHWQSRALDAEGLLADVKPARARAADAHQRLTGLLGIVWRSRRRWQAENAVLRRRMLLAEALCGLEQLRGKRMDAGVRADLVTHILWPSKGSEPPGWEQLRPILERSLNSGGPDEVSV